MSRWVVVSGVAWVVVAVLAFVIDPVLGAFVAIFGAIGVVVVALGSTYDQHPDFEARELARARRRAVKREQYEAENKDAIEADRARYAEHQAKLAARRAAAERAAAEGGTADRRASDR
jgi:ABC-type protease/lipase transport system fused ATPase/permease subunit